MFWSHWSKQTQEKYSKNKTYLFFFTLKKCAFHEEFVSIWIAKLTFLSGKWSVCHTALVSAIITLTPYLAQCTVTDSGGINAETACMRMICI